MKKRILSIVTALCLCLVLLPAEAWAADEPVDITDTGLLISAKDIPTEAVTYTAGEGTVTVAKSADDSTINMTLNNATITAEERGIYISEIADTSVTNVNVTLKGENSITVKGRGLEFGQGSLYVNTKVTINGTGHLDIKVTEKSISGLGDSNGIYVYSDFEMTSGTVDITGPETGIFSNDGDIIISGDAVMNIRDTGYGAYLFWSDNNTVPDTGVTVKENGELNVINSDYAVYAIVVWYYDFSYHGYISVEDNGKISIQKNTTYGLAGNIVSISDTAVVDISSGTAAVFGYGDGIDSSAVSISGGTITTTSDTYGIYTGGGDISISGTALVTATGAAGVAAAAATLVEDTATLNAIVRTTAAEGRTYTVYGEAVMISNLTVGPNEYDSSFPVRVVFTDGSILTISEGVTLDASTDGITMENLSDYLSTTGQIVVDGTLLLPANTTTEQIEDLNIEGDGQIQVAPVDESENPTTYHIISFMDDTKILSKQYIVSGETLAQPSAPIKNGYSFNGWFTEADCTDGNEYDFTAPVTRSLSLYSKWTAVSNPGSSGGGSSTPTYRPTVEDSAGGNTIVSPESPGRGNTVTVTPKPDEGYEVGEITITDRNGDPVKVTDNGDGTYRFTQPTGKVAISVTYKLIDTSCNGGAGCPSLALTDLSTTAWYHEAVDYVLENGVMSGYGSGIFGPDNSLSRAMLCQILYNMEDRPAAGQSAFEDVANGAWYADAVTWANASGIVGGYGHGRFGPDDPATREQLVSILWHYAQYKGYDTTQGGMAIREFSDYESISSYAVDAMTWAVNTGVVSGYGDKTLRPQSGATRAEVAQMFMNFKENI